MMEQNFFAVCTGFAPVTSTVTEWHSNWAELTHQIVPGAGVEPARPQWPRDFKQYLLLDYLITIFISELRFRKLKPVIKKTVLLR